MANHILQALQQRGFVVKECGCYTGLNAVQTFHSPKTFGALWSENDDKEDPQTVGQVKSYNNYTNEEKNVVFNTEAIGLLGFKHFECC